MADTYANYLELARAQREGTDFLITVCDRGSQLVVVAPHGGAIEPGTSEIALAVASDSLSYYLFEGLKSKRNGELHITSTNFDEPRGLQLVSASMMVLALHGEGSMHEVVFLGGREDELGSRLRQSLNNQGFDVAVHENQALQGLNPRNICNRGRLGRGLQLEISKGLRRTFFQSLEREGRREKTTRFFDFVSAISSAIR